ncbi:MAG: hypothetical protein HY812_03790 [Planctomycetes bacterium]|nr:hypothetical protein [Planctomycetota bacterium]
MRLPGDKLRSEIPREAAALARLAVPIALAAALLPIAGLFQVFDGTQAVACGVLRGAGETRLLMMINLLG